MSWTEYEGHAVSAWRLHSFLGLRGAAACYAGVEGDGSAVLIQIANAGDAEAEQLRTSWETARNLSNPHLLCVHGTGSAVIDDAPVVFAALEMPDDDLAELAARRSVAADEARAIIAAAASALQYLHSRDLRHGAVCQSNIVYVGDTPKLAVDTLAASGEAGCDADLRQLGNTIVETVAGESTLGAAERLPAPLHDIVLGCWSGSEGGWTAATVVEAASGRSAPPARRAEPVRPETGRARDGASSGVKTIRLRWPAIALVAAGLTAGIFYLRRDSPSPAPASVVPTAQHPSPSSDAPARAIPPQTSAPAATARKAERSNSWAVIAATYANFDAAQKRAQKLARGLRAHVYPPQGRGNRYYVVLGSGLSSDAARKLRARAIRSGAPHDTYVTQLPAD